jgi:predicted Ser/Thr protein kinase
MAAGALAGLCPACLLKQGAADTAAQPEAKSFEPPPIAELAQLFPQLEILDLLGKGGMGAVYKARQKPLDRLVALKILPPRAGEDPAFAERFTREARALARLNHPGIVTLYEFGRTPGGLYYFLMEFVDGVSLRQLLAHGRISPREALAIVPQICDALQFAHDQGIVHRDIKPDNVLLDRRGRVKVADFGLAKLVGTGSESAAAPTAAGSPTLTEAGKVMGTPQYMAPEQVEHPEEVDHRADIYALGVVFYQMLTGELPGKTLEPPSKKVEIDVRLDEIVLRALEKEPALRYQQASEVKTGLETLTATTGPSSPVGGATAAPETRPSMEASHLLRRKQWDRAGAYFILAIFSFGLALFGRLGEGWWFFFLIGVCCAVAGFQRIGMALGLIPEASSGARPKKSPTPPGRRWNATAIGTVLLVGLAILIAIYSVLLSRVQETEFKLPSAVLPQFKLLQLVDSNLIAEAKIVYGRQSTLTQVVGTYYASEDDKERKIATRFQTSARLSPSLQFKLLSLPQFKRTEAISKSTRIAVNLLTWVIALWVVTSISIGLIWYFSMRRNSSQNTQPPAATADPGRSC